VDTLNPNFVFGLSAVLGVVVFITLVVSHQRTVAAYTQAMSVVDANKPLIDLGHSLAVDVVPVEVAHKALDALTSVATLIKTFAPPDVNAAIDETIKVGKDVVDDTPASQPPANPTPQSVGTSSTGVSQ